MEGPRDPAESLREAIERADDPVLKLRAIHKLTTLLTRRDLREGLAPRLHGRALIAGNHTVLFDDASGLAAGSTRLS